MRSLHLALKPTLIHIRGISLPTRVCMWYFCLLNSLSPPVIICIVYLPLLSWQYCSMKRLRLIVLLLQRPLETKLVWRIIQSRCSVHRKFCCPNNRYHMRLVALKLVILVFRCFTDRQLRQPPQIYSISNVMSIPLILFCITMHVFLEIGLPLFCWHCFTAVSIFRGSKLCLSIADKLCWKDEGMKCCKVQ